MYQIDLNADLGEGCADDSQIIPLLSSANISCIAHAGSAADVASALACCRQHAVVVGAHPSYPDRANFGRLSMTLPPQQLLDSLHAQIDWLCQQAQLAGVRVRYIKLHGALYNDAAQNPALAQLLTEFFSQQYPTLAMLTLPAGALFSTAKQAGLSVYSEAFADRAYQANGQLVSRQQSGAILTQAQAIAQTLQLVCQQQISCIDGPPFPLQADSLCLHGDSPQALVLAQELRQALQQAGVHIRAFCQD